jgi:glutamate-1-semialdehyde 2,1-aminomutase
MTKSSNTGQELYRRARQRIPGGTQLLSKRPEMLLPEQWPSYYSRASGSRIWDLDGNSFVDMSYSGIGSCVLGYADPDVDEAVHTAIKAGSMSTLNCPEEVELADLLCEIHPWADMVRYTRSGGEAMAVAVRIARTHTRRDKIAFCGYHGWHDWYLAANLGSNNALEGHLLPGLSPAGVPGALGGTALPFHYNRVEELERIASEHGGELAAVVMEPVRNHPPNSGFLEQVRDIAHRCGAVLVFDEITAGWRLNSGGVHLLYGVSPDIAVFAKAISNGYPMAAIIGTGHVMQAAQDSFISSTYWTERIGPTAALATIRKHRACDVPARLIESGRKVQEIWRLAAERAGLPITVSGLPPLAHFTIDAPEAQAARTLFTQLMLGRGFLASNAFYASYAQSKEDIDAYGEATTESFAELARAIAAGTVQDMLKGPVAHAGFYRLA